MSSHMYQDLDLDLDLMHAQIMMIAMIALLCICLHAGHLVASLPLCIFVKK